MFLNRLVLGASLIFAITPATAQEKIAPDAFLDRADGRTLTFTDLNSGSKVGVEQFLSRKLSVWAQTDGRCSYGDIEIRGDQLCFIYRDFPNPENCWLTFDTDGQLMVLSTSSFQIQKVTRIGDEPVDCVEAPIS